MKEQTSIIIYYPIHLFDIELDNSLEKCVGRPVEKSTYTIENGRSLKFSQVYISRIPEVNHKIQKICPQAVLEVQD